MNRGFCVVLLGWLGCISAHADWVAYNDLIWGVGQPTSNITTNSPTAITNGYLTDYASGQSLGAELRFAGPAVSAGAPLGANPIPAGTDAYTEFGSAVNGDGFVFLGTTGTLFFTVTQLDTNSRFDLIIYSSRQATSETYDNRWTEIQISDFASFTNASSAGVQQLQTGGSANDTSRIVAGNTNGRVVRFTGINTGSDGDFDINIKGYATPGYSTNAYINAIKLIAHGQGSAILESTNFEATAAVSSNGQLLARWRVTANQKHRLQYKTALSDPSWSVYATNLSTTGTALDVSIPVTGTRRYFRMAQEGNPWGQPPTSKRVRNWILDCEGWLLKPAESGTHYTSTDRIQQIDQWKAMCASSGVRAVVSIPIAPEEWLNNSGTLIYTNEWKNLLDYITVTKGMDLCISMGGNMYVAGEVPVNPAQSDTGQTFSRTYGVYTYYTPSMMSAPDRSNSTLRINRILDWLIAGGYGNKIVKFNLRHGNTGEWYLHHNHDVSTNAYGLFTDWSPTMLAAWRTWLGNKYGVGNTLPADYASHGFSQNTSSVLMPNPSSTSGGINGLADLFRYTGTAGRDLADFFGYALADYWTFVNALIKARNSAWKTSFFPADTLGGGSVGHHFNSTAYLPILALCDTYYHTDGSEENWNNFVAHPDSYYKKYLPTAFVRGMYGYVKESDVQLDPPDCGLQNIDGGDGSWGTQNTNGMQIQLEEFVKRGGDDIWTAMYFKPGRVLGLWQPIMQTIHDKYEANGAWNPPDYSHLPETTVDINPALYGDGSLHNTLKNSWESIGGATSNVAVKIISQ